jgi:hypothetical protein
LVDYLKTIKLIHNYIFSPNCYSDSVNIISNIKYLIKKCLFKRTPMDIHISSDYKTGKSIGGYQATRGVDGGAGQQSHRGGT